MDDESKARLAKMFPGDIEGGDGAGIYTAPSKAVPREAAATPDPVIARKFKQIVASLSHDAPPPPVAVTLPKPHLIENPANAASWVREATDIRSDVALGQAVEPHRVTRLLLEAIPVVEAYAAR